MFPYSRVLILELENQNGLSLKNDHGTTKSSILLDQTRAKSVVQLPRKRWSNPSYPTLSWPRYFISKWFNDTKIINSMFFHKIIYIAGLETCWRWPRRSTWRRWICIGHALDQHQVGRLWLARRSPWSFSSSDKEKDDERPCGQEGLLLTVFTAWAGATKLHRYNVVKKSIGILFFQWNLLF